MIGLDLLLVGHQTVGQTAKQTMTPGPRIAESFNSKSLASRPDCLGSQIHKYTNAQIQNDTS